MFNNWHKKEKPIQGMMGFGGGATGYLVGGNALGPFQLTGGTKSVIGDYTFHKFTNGMPGTFTVDDGLTEEIKETVSLSVPIGTKLVYFDRIEFHWPMQLNLEAGDHLPLHASASGKLYLSSIKKNDALEIFKNIKTPKTAKNTITEISKFKTELNKINKQGYAFDDEEWFN